MGIARLGPPLTFRALPICPSRGWVGPGAAVFEESSDADRVRAFYEAVVGWKADPVEMGGYSDCMMSARGGGPETGICHQRGANAYLPPVWMIYIGAEDLDESLRQCRELGGKTLGEACEYGED